jgi:hypothetical protein
MKRFFILISMLGLLTTICSTDFFIVNSNSQTLSKVNIQTFATNNSFAQIGLYGNDIVYHDQKLYVVNSGDHNVQIINAQTGSTIGHIFLENSSNPMHIVIHDGYAYVSGLYSNKVYKINLSDTTDITSLTVGSGPVGMVIHGNKLFVAISGFIYVTYLPGKVCVIDLDAFSIIDDIDVYTNPQQLLIDNQGLLHVICTGNYFDQFSKVAIINTTTHQIVRTISFSTFLSTISEAPNGTKYLAHYLGAGFYTYHPTTYAISGPIYPNSFSLAYDDSFIYVIESTWTSPSTLKKYTHDFALVGQTNIGLAAIAMASSSPLTTTSDTTIPAALDVTIYPNPFTDHIRLAVKSLSTDTKVTVYNIKGQKMAEQIGNLVWNGRDMQDRPVPPGIYFIKVSDDSRHIIKKALRM